MFNIFLAACRQGFATAAAAPADEQAPGALSDADKGRLAQQRNIGISAHIDSGKTTLTERILYYTGRIDEIHEVRGKDNVGAKMDSMELEREKGITIQSAATFTNWDGHFINIIDTPGHLDFILEVERALRVLDSAVLVLCAVGGVQVRDTLHLFLRDARVYVRSRFAVANHHGRPSDETVQQPRICFINKMDRAGANPARIVEQLRNMLRLHACAVQLPIGAEDRILQADEISSEKVIVKEIPAEMLSAAKEKRAELTASVAEVDDEIADLFLSEEEPSAEQLTVIVKITRTKLTRSFFLLVSRVLRKTRRQSGAPRSALSSSYHNKGVQPMLDGVISYLPAPHEVANHGLDAKQEEAKCGSHLRQTGRTLRKGDWIVNARTGKRVKVPRLVRMHSNEMEDVDMIASGEIFAVFGIECASGDTFTDGTASLTMTSMFVPKPVISLSVEPKGKERPTFPRPYKGSSAKEATQKGSLIGAPITGTRFVLEDGMSHPVDSSEIAFKLAGLYAFREAYMKAGAQILEPVMSVNVSAPSEFQRGCDDYVEVAAEVPLNDMFGFSTDLRSVTQGKGEFTMEYKDHVPVLPGVQAMMVAEYQKKMQAKAK
ncbi:Elongation factor G, mitochondrial [Cladochytrium tenue]|nr:Elongation factor G, mitochondrial [Cladochytrium tenue]